ncbi:serine arginine-rich splicing factor 10-like isoform X1 [Brachionus plicatilis]|uniref:Serine arginine-rich splicing factor 10-like isoform X1 n=1 Tax=Brachionus plicatilis TaxID=10195 RepID=A0A3M7RIQ9_BRAPC|nr:serine arginine-rich splicing factor 10-like isoform X1 [Brachionus plicatilis]
MSRYRPGPSTTLYIRNISDRVRYDDLKRLFSKYGRVLDITIPLDYYSGMPKGFSFDPRDAEEAQYRMDRQRLFGREIEVEFARGDRKTPGEMRTRDRGGRYPRREYDRRDDYERRSRSRSPVRERERDRRRMRSRSREERSRSRRSRSYSKNRTPSPKARSVSRDRSISRDRSVSPKRNDRSPKSNGNMSRSPSPA